MSSACDSSLRSLRLALHLFKVAVQGAAGGGMFDEPLVAQTLPESKVEACLGCILFAGADGGGVTEFRIVGRHVRIEERAAIGSILMDDTLPLEQPVAMAIRLSGRNQYRIRLVDAGAQMLLGPGEQVAPLRAEPVKIGDIQSAGHVPARHAASLAATAGAGEAVHLAFGGGLAHAVCRC